MTPVGCDAGPMHVSSRHMPEDTVSERLRSWTRNPMGSARKGSNHRCRIQYAVTRMLGLCQPFPQPRRRLRAQVPARAVRLFGPAVAGCNFKARAEDTRGQHAKSSGWLKLILWPLSGPAGGRFYKSRYHEVT